jgi:putative ABC transport system ATP-binding protein
VSAPPAVVNIEALRFAWPGMVKPLLNIDEWHLDAGEQVFVFGPSGCGKSTLLSLISGVQLAQQGRISVLQQDLSSLSGARRDRYRVDHIGFIFQQFNLIPYLSALENVLLPLRFSARRAQRIQEADIHHEAQRLLRALDVAPALANQPARLLSVGQQQRVAAARALIGRPELVIADEPTSSLDAERQQAFLQLLASECQASGASLLFVSHDQRLANGFHRVLDLSMINHA